MNCRWCKPPVLVLEILARRATQNSNLSLPVVPPSGLSGDYGNHPVVYTTGKSCAALRAISDSQP